MFDDDSLEVKFRQLLTAYDLFFSSKQIFKKTFFRLFHQSYQFEGEPILYSANFIKNKLTNSENQVKTTIGRLFQ